MHVRSSVISFTFLAGVLCATACSSSDPPPATIDPGGNDASASNHDSGGGTQSDGGTTPPPGSDGGGTADTGSTTPDGGGHGGGDASDVPEGGVAVTPGIVQCGGSDCHVDSNTCCVPSSGTPTCTAGTGKVCPSGQASIHCLEKADCTGADLCCGTFNLQALSADSACGAGPCATVQFCRTNSECNGKACVPQTCQGQPLELCGLQTGFGCTAR